MKKRGRPRNEPMPETMGPEEALASEWRIFADSDHFEEEEEGRDEV